MRKRTTGLTTPLSKPLMPDPNNGEDKHTLDERQFRKVLAMITEFGHTEIQMSMKYIKSKK